MIKIVQKENPVLRLKAREVSLPDVSSKKIKRVIRDMTKALETQDDGVAIAAPQIGESLRIFVISKRVFEMVDKRDKKRSLKDVVFINPKLTKLSKEKVVEDEGCLSIRYLYGKVKRAKKATIEALDERGKKFVTGGSGIIAQIFQHECDHLDGILFTDKAKELQEILPQKNEIR